MGRLAGKVAIVTGAAKGLGAADARHFVAEGARVMITDVDEAGGRALAEELGEAAAFTRQDVRDELAWKALVDDVVERWGRLDILVNNAGVVEVGTPETITADDLHFVMAVSLNGTVWGCKYAIPAMAKNGAGSIVNMASVASIQGEPYVAGYCAAKGAVEAYSRAVAVHCAQRKMGIRSNSIHPATMDTPMVRSMIGKVRESGVPPANPGMPTRAPNPLGSPDDIANLVVYLASDESRFVSGQKFIVDSSSSVTPGSVPS